MTSFVFESGTEMLDSLQSRNADEKGLGGQSKSSEAWLRMGVVGLYLIPVFPETSLSLLNVFLLLFSSSANDDNETLLIPQGEEHG